MKKNIISFLLCTAMLFTVCMAGLTAAAATDYSGPGQNPNRGYEMGDTVIVDGMKYECTGYWVTTEPPGNNWNLIGPADSSDITNPPGLDREVPVYVTINEKKWYVGYGTLDDVLNNPAGNKLRNPSLAEGFLLKDGVPMIFYMTDKAGSVNSYEDCVLINLTNNNLTVTGASFDGTGIKEKEDCNYKVEARMVGCKFLVSSISVGYLEKDSIFSWTESTTILNGYYTYIPERILTSKELADIAWTSSDENIFTIEQNSYISPHHRGSADLIATLPDGSTQSLALKVNLDLTMKVGKSSAIIGVPPIDEMLVKIEMTKYAQGSPKIQYATNSSGTYTTMAPVRFLGEITGYTVDYTEENQQVKLTDKVDGRYIIMHMGETAISAYQQDGTELTVFNLPAPVMLIEGITYAPLRTISEYSGFHCQFLSDGENDYVILDDYPSGLSQEDYQKRIQFGKKYI